jgi:Fe-S cluster assembly protein SufD
MSVPMKNAISIVFIDGCFSADQSNLTLLPEEVLFCSFSAVVNWLQGVFIYVPKNVSVSIPIYLIFQSSGKKDVMSYLRHTIVLEENSHATLIEEYSGSLAENYVTNASTELQLGKNATLQYYKLQDENVVATHQAAILVQQQESSQSKLFFADCGSQTATMQLRVNLHEKYAACDLSGLYLTRRDTQQIDNKVHVDHKAEYGVSSMQFKGILDNQSRAGFVGKVFVHEEAQHINAQQANHNLLLSSSAEVSTKPELEIYADDVKCSHGATVGQLDEDALFYLRARGIDKTTAMRLLTQAFAEDVMNKIENTTIRQYIHERMGQHETL